MSESRLKIHTRMSPAPVSSPETPRDEDKSFFHRRFTGKHRPAQGGAASAARPRIGKMRASRLSRTDRLLRNSALACALLLGILALGNVDQPWAQRLSGSIGKALTMRIDLDSSFGELSFVRRIMPESALVFLNISGGTPLRMPVEGTVGHPWSSQQPWLMIDCGDDSQALACADGTVTAVSPISGGLFGVLLDHGEGLESTYARLSHVDVKAGDVVAKGGELGAVSGSLYFEYRSGGESINPSEGLGLS